MASILRSGKLLRHFAGFTRNIVVNSIRDAESGTLLQNTPCMCSPFQHGYANNVAPKADLSLEKQIRRLDQDVRRVGRISRRDIEEVMEEIRSQRTATSSQSLLVIRCCGNLVPEELPEVRTALVQEIWKTLNALNVPMDISHYNALLRVYLENEHQFSPTDFLSEIESKNIEPNRVTYQRLITRYCQQGDIEGATRILEFMREKNLPVNENVFNSLILGHSQANDLESAKGILTVMAQAGLELSADTYTTLLCAFGRHGDIESILKTLEECEVKEIFLLDKDLLDVVYHLTINGHGDKVDAVLAKLRISTGFNQDAVNVILRLVNKGYEDTSFKILRIMPRGTRVDGQLVDVGTFFIKQLVKADRPLEKILSICKALHDEGLNTKALLIATEAGLQHGKVNNAIPLLKEMKNAGLPIRQHYFWPIICSEESSQILNIIRRMQDEFDLHPSAETIRDYVIPNMKEKNLDKIVMALRDVGVSNAVAASAVAFMALTENKLQEAAAIIESYRANYTLAFFKQPLNQAISVTNDYSSFVRFVRQIYESVENRDNNQNEQKSEQAATDAEASEHNETESGVSGANDVVGNALNDMCVYLRRDCVQALENVLPLFVKEGLSISNTNANRISERIGSEMTPLISEYLGKLSSGELEPVPLKNTQQRKRGLESLTIEELERFIVNVEAKGENANNIKRFLITACFRSKNLEKAEQVIEKLKADNFNMHVGIYAQLLDLYTLHGKSAEFLALYKDLQAKDADFVLDNFKTLRFIDLLLKEERFDEGIEFLKKNKKQQLPEEEGTFNYESIVWRLLNSLAEKGDSQKLQKLFDTLIENNYIIPKNTLLGPLVKVHLVNDNIEKAIETFENCCEKYKSTPWKNELACRLIQKEDASNLQKLTDLSTNIHGEVNSLYDLVFSFVECGRIRQARKILETPGLRTRPHRIDSACERYRNEGKVQPLEGLAEATKDLGHIDRNKIYYNLLLSYQQTEDTEKALGLWTKMQEEDINVSDAFLIKLAEFLRQKNVNVPFVVPNVVEENVTNVKPVASISSQRNVNIISAVSEPRQQSTSSQFRKALLNRDIEGALSIKRNLNGTKLNVTDISRLVEQLLRADRLSEANKFVEELLTNKQRPILKILKFYLNKVAAAGDIATLDRIDKLIDDELKRLISFDNRYCNAYINAGKAVEYIQSLSDDISKASTTEDVAKLAVKFPRGGALGILAKHPEVLPQFEQIAEKFAKFNQLGPINVLWIYHISNGNETASKAIWDKFLSNAPRLMFQRVLQTAREQKDGRMVQTVIDQLRESKISVGAIGNAYSCLIDIQINNAEPEKALEALKTALKDVSLEHINRTALIRLKQALLEKKKEFPYEIPEKKSRHDSVSSTSSEDDDDDFSPKTPETRPQKPNQKLK
ncbi:leucine-rich PPR motif-containing protein, mitochondrial [Teleopsis dalmanni]|uniref:leucine-rich PPR motif-containing protein, mitochondrial n=1 Tax=Teleopsis dalmanni TaxID=139649 RepID=UPI0018CDC3EB|nr:leucine-rich PPR motif-containing protein, mitochondrial [Teleopsis dalmanni]